MTDEDTQNGKWKNVTVGKITLNYKRNADEKTFTAPSGRKIYLSDLYFTVPVNSDKCEFTLKYSDGTSKKIDKKELWSDYTAFQIENPFDNSTVDVTTSDDNIRANFFKDAISTGDVTSVIYAGEEYTLTKTAEDKQTDYPLDITADKVVCSQHGMYMRLTITAANDTGKSIIKKSLTSEHGENTVRLSGGDQADAPQPNVNLGKSVTTVGWYTTLVESTENKLVYDCYLPMTRSVDMDLNFAVYAVMQDPTLTADEIAEGIGRNKKLGSIKVKYEKPMQEREFVCGDKKILLSDLCLGISNVADDVTEITLKKADGSQEKLTEQDFEQCCIVKYGDESSGDDFEAKHKSFTQIAAPEDFRANFITKQVDTSKVTSITYAGEEYTLTSQK